MKKLRWNWLAILPLVIGSVTIFTSLRLIAFKLFGYTQLYSLSLTVILGVLCIISQVLARKLSNNTLRNTGIMCVLILSGKVLFKDMPTFGTAYTMVALGTLTAVFAVTSVCFQKLKSETP
jgi:hypothetical protein